MKAVITGGAMGIGYAAAKAFRQKGYDVLIIDICESGAESAKEIGADFVKCDVSDAAAVKATAESTGKVDVVVCNAAVQTVCDWDEVDYDDFRKIIDVNLCGAFYTVHAFSRYMKKGGKIVFVTSVHGEKPRLDKFAYDASKAAIGIMTKECALALAPKGISVNAVALGATYTPMNSIFDTDKKAEKSARKKIPFGRIYTAEEAAEVIVAVTGKTFDYVTGEIINVDGGRSLV